MAKRSRNTPDNVVEIRDFPGLITNADPNDIPPGAACEQVNVTATIFGQLRPRGGYRVVKFEE